MSHKHGTVCRALVRHASTNDRGDCMRVSYAHNTGSLKELDEDISLKVAPETISSCH